MISTLDANPDLKETVARKALAIGAIRRGVNEESNLTTFDSLTLTEQNNILANITNSIQNGNQKLVGIANQVVNNFNENGQGNTSTIPSQKNPLRNT